MTNFRTSTVFRIYKRFTSKYSTRTTSDVCRYHVYIDNRKAKRTEDLRMFVKDKLQIIYYNGGNLIDTYARVLR